MNLVEVTASTLLVTVLLLASVQATTGMVGNQAIADAHLEAEWVADDLLAEVAAMPFALTDDDRTLALATPSLSLRSGKVEMADYNGFQQSPPIRVDGSSINRLTGWTSAVSIAEVLPDAPDTVIATEAGEIPLLIRITVTMTDATGSSFTRTRLITRHAQSIGLAGVVDAFGRVDMQTDAGSQRIQIPFFNLPAR